MNKIKIFLLTISLMFLASLAAIFISREFIFHNKISDLSCLLNIWKDTYGWNFLMQANWNWGIFFEQAPFGNVTYLTWLVDGFLTTAALFVCAISCKREGEKPRRFEPSAARQHRVAMAPKGGALAHNPSLTAILKEELQQCGSFCIRNFPQEGG